DHGVEALQVVVAELRWILRRLDDEAAGRAEGPDRGDAVGDGGVAAPFRARENEDPRARRRIADGASDGHSAGGLLAVARDGGEGARDGGDHEAHRRAMA